MSDESYIIDGIRYGSIDDIPEPMRSEVRRALSQADRLVTR